MQKKAVSKNQSTIDSQYASYNTPTAASIPLARLSSEDLVVEELHKIYLSWGLRSRVKTCFSSLALSIDHIFCEQLNRDNGTRLKKRDEKCTHSPKSAGNLQTDEHTEIGGYDNRLPPKSGDLKMCF